jgi:hypothetical protein
MSGQLAVPRKRKEIPQNPQLGGHQRRLALVGTSLKRSPKRAALFSVVVGSQSLVRLGLEKEKVLALR